MPIPLVLARKISHDLPPACAGKKTENLPLLWAGNQPEGSPLVSAGKPSEDLPLVSAGKRDGLGRQLDERLLPGSHDGSAGTAAIGCQLKNSE